MKTLFKWIGRILLGLLALILVLVVAVAGFIYYDSVTAATPTNSQIRASSARMEPP